MFIVETTDTFTGWFDALRDRQAEQRIRKRLDRITKGHLGDVKAIGQGISETRIHAGPGYRIYFQQRGTVIILLLCGGDKGSQDADIRLAHALAKALDSSP